jgi:hypothetical protein
MEHEQANVWCYGAIVMIAAIIEALFLSGNGLIGLIVVGIVVYLIGSAWGLNILWAKECERIDYPGKSLACKAVALASSLIGWWGILLCKGYDQLKQRYRRSRQKKVQYNSEIVSQPLA